MSALPAGRPAHLRPAGDYRHRPRRRLRRLRGHAGAQRLAARRAQCPGGVVRRDGPSGECRAYRAGHRSCGEAGGGDRLRPHRPDGRSGAAALRRSLRRRLRRAVGAARPAQRRVDVALGIAFATGRNRPDQRRHLQDGAPAGGLRPPHVADVGAGHITAASRIEYPPHHHAPAAPATFCGGLCAAPRRLGREGDPPAGGARGGEVVKSVINPLAYLDDELREMKARGLFRWPRLLTGPQAPVAVYDGREVINLCSNNYLDLANHPRLKEAARRAIDDLGVGPGAVRTIAGNMAIHRELEAELARFKRTEATLLFQSGFTANAGTVSAVLGKEDVIVSDELTT